MTPFDFGFQHKVGSVAPSGVPLRDTYPDAAESPSSLNDDATSLFRRLQNTDVQAKGMLANSRLNKQAAAYPQRGTPYTLKSFTYPEGRTYRTDRISPTETLDVLVRPTAPAAPPTGIAAGAALKGAPVAAAPGLLERFTSIVKSHPYLAGGTALAGGAALGAGAYALANRKPRKKAKYPRKESLPATQKAAAAREKMGGLFMKDMKQPRDLNVVTQVPGDSTNYVIPIAERYREPRLLARPFYSRQREIQNALQLAKQNAPAQFASENETPDPMQAALIGHGLTRLYPDRYRNSQFDLNDNSASQSFASPEEEAQFDDELAQLEALEAQDKAAPKAVAAPPTDPRYYQATADAPIHQLFAQQYPGMVLTPEMMSYLRPILLGDEYNPSNKEHRNNPGRIALEKAINSYQPPKTAAAAMPMPGNKPAMPKPAAPSRGAARGAVGSPALPSPASPPPAAPGGLNRVGMPQPDMNLRAQAAQNSRNRSVSAGPYGSMGGSSGRFGRLATAAGPSGGAPAAPQGNTAFSQLPEDQKWMQVRQNMANQKAQLAQTRALRSQQTQLAQQNAAQQYPVPVSTNSAAQGAASIAAGPPGAAGGFGSSVVQSARPMAPAAPGAAPQQPLQLSIGSRPAPPAPASVVARQATPTAPGDPTNPVNSFERVLQNSWNNIQPRLSQAGQMGQSQGPSAIQQALAGLGGQTPGQGNSNWLSPQNLPVLLKMFGLDRLIGNAA